MTSAPAISKSWFGMTRRFAPALIAIFSIFVFCASTLPAHADNVLLRALKEEMDRSKTKLKMDNVAAPYYIEYRVTELDAFEASAVFGALRSQQRGSGRFLRVVVRIGDYKQDSYYSSGEGAVDMIPLDGDTFAIRHRVWLATDRAYKAAGEALSAKQASPKPTKGQRPGRRFRAPPPHRVNRAARATFNRRLHALVTPHRRVIRALS